MKLFKYILLTTVLFLGQFSYSQTTLSGVTLSGVEINAPATAYDADYQAILDYATGQAYTLPSNGRKLIESNALAAAKTCFGVSAIADAPIVAAYNFHTDGDSDFVTLNWVNPSIRQVTKVNSPLFETLKGFNSNGTSSYLNIPVTPLSFTSQNDFTVAVRAHTNVAGSVINVGVFDAPGVGTERLSFNPRNLSNQVIIFAFDNTVTPIAIAETDARQTWMFGRSNSTTRRYSKNGANFTTNTETSNPAENAYNMFGLAGNNANTGALSFSTQGLSFLWFFNRALTNTECNCLYTNVFSPLIAP